MKLNRRDLFKTMGAAAVVTTIPTAEAAAEQIPEIPAPAPLPPQRLPALLPGMLSPDQIAAELVIQLHRADRAYFAHRCVEGLTRIGDTVRLDGYRNFVVDRREVCCWEDEWEDRNLPRREYSRRYIEPVAIAMSARMRANMLATELERPVCGMAHLVVPESCVYGWQWDYEGVSARAMRDYSIETDDMVMRADVLYGITQAA